MDIKKAQFEAGQQGSGSAEETGRERADQVNPGTHLSNGEREDIAAQIGEDPGAVASIEELGGMSGRDDVSGGSGDRMEEQSTGQNTDR